MCYTCTRLGIDPCQIPSDSEAENSFDEEPELESMWQLNEQMKQYKRKLEQHPERRKRGGQQPQPSKPSACAAAAKVQEQPQPEQFHRSARCKQLIPQPKTMVHSAPGHGGIPAFVAYSVRADTPDSADLMLWRTEYAYVFYDTSLGAVDLGRAEKLACSIFTALKTAVALRSCQTESKSL